MQEHEFSRKQNHDNGTTLATVPQSSNLTARDLEKRSQTQMQEGTGDVPMTDQWRILTILFCDVVGSTAMAERLDAEEWADVMHQAFEYLILPINRYGGTVARLMGDAILAFFGAPDAHEDDPQRAILAGLDILDAIRPFNESIRSRYGLDFNVRVGINTGHVVVGEFGARDRFEYTAMGDAINVAARVQELARPGTVQVASATYRLSAPLFEFEPLGDIDIRGKSRPEAIYRVVRSTSVPGRLWDVAGLGTPLVGRDHEMSLLRQALDDLRSGQGRIVLLVGDAGLGKSRLLEELRRYGNPDRRVRGQDHGAPHVEWLEIRLHSFEALQPYGAFEQRLRQGFGIDPADTLDVVHEKVTERVKEMPPEAQAQAIRVVDRVLAADSMAGRGPLETSSSEPDGDAFKREMYAVFLEILRNWNAGGPVAFIGDDHQWFDTASAELMCHVLQLVTQMPILFVSAFRPEDQSPVQRVREFALSQFGDRCIEIHLDPLSEQASRQLVDSLVEIPDSYDELRQAILKKAEGVPLFIEEIVRSLIDHGALESSGEGAEKPWRPVPTFDVSTISIPDSIQALMLERLDNLQADTRRILQQAAVVGRTFSSTILQSVAQSSSSELEDQLELLERLGQIYTSGNEPEREYTFRQTLMWEVVYSTMLRRQRRDAHRRVAEVLENHYREHLDEHAASIGHHFFRAGDARAISWLLRAASRAQSFYEPESVREYVSMAQGLADELNLDMPANAYQLRGHAHELVGDYEAAREDFHRAIERAKSQGDLRDEWRALIGLGSAWVERDYDQAGRYYRLALDLARQLADEPLLAHSLNRLGNWNSNTGAPQAAFQLHEEAAMIFDKLEDKRGGAETRDFLGTACYLAGDLPSSACYFDQAVAQFRAVEDRQGLVSSLSMRTLTHGTVLDRVVVPADGLVGVSRYAEEAVSIAREINWEAGESFAEFTLALSADIRGNYSDALAHAKRAQRIAEQIGHRQWTVAAHVALGHITLNLFQFEESRQHFELASTAARQMGSDNWTNLITAGLAEVHLSRNELDQSSHLLASFNGDDSPPNTVARRNIWLQQAALELAEGNFEESLAIIDALARTEPHHIDAPVIPDVELLRAIALTRLRRYRDAEHALQSARTRAEQLSYRPILWRIDLALAELYRAQADETGSKQALARTKTITDDLASMITDERLQSRFRHATEQLLEDARRPIMVSLPVIGAGEDRDRTAKAVVAQRP